MRRCPLTRQQVTRASMGSSDRAPDSIGLMSKLAAIRVTAAGHTQGVSRTSILRITERIPEEAVGYEHVDELLLAWSLVCSRCRNEDRCHLLKSRQRRAAPPGLASPPAPPVEVPGLPPSVLGPDRHPGAPKFRFGHGC